VRKRWLLALLLIVSCPGGAAADDEWRFRRTTPRAQLSGSTSLSLGVPGGRAWGIESALRPLGPAALAFDLTVRDPAVREAFLRVAWYDRDTGRPRQRDLADSLLVRAGEERTLQVELEPPPGAVAYRVRVLARLADGATRSASDAIRVTLAAAMRAQPAFTRLRAASP
jgi:hypothetical protein